MSIQIGWPQGIWITLTVLGLIVAGIEHGKPRKPINVWASLASTLIVAGLLAWGWFFS